MPTKPEKEKPEENSSEKLPDRPLECGECKKPITVHYTEIIGNNITHTCMCHDCPELQRRLHGIPAAEAREGATDVGAGLACGNCGTTLDSLRVGHPLGCASCYEVFEDVLLLELASAGKIPGRLSTNKKTAPVHIGRAPGESHEMNTSMRLLALNEALNETLKREDYEQAALLRDQIKALTKEKEKEEEKKKNEGK